MNRSFASFFADGGVTSRSRCAPINRRAIRLGKNRR
jgi:hypothetical protein